MSRSTIAMWPPHEPHCVSSMSTLTTFVPLCVQTDDSFDLYELIHAEGAASRERTGGLGAGSRM